MRDIIYYAAWLVILPLSLVSAHVAVLSWVWVALLPPADLLYGSLGFILPFNKFAAAAAFFSIVINSSKNKFYFDGLMMCVFLYFLIVTGSYFLDDYSSPISDLQYDKFWKEVVLFFTITGVMYNRHRLHQITLVISTAFGFLMVKEGLIFLLTAGGHKIAATGTTGDNNGVAMALLMTIPFLLFCARYSDNRLIKSGILFTTVLGTVTVIATYSRGGFIGLIVLGLMLLKGSRHKFRSIIGLACLGIIMFALAPDTYMDRINTISDAGSDDSFATRLLAWKINYLMALDHPFLGNGLYASLNWGNWSRHLGEAVTWLFPSPLVLRTFVAHSIYFQVLGDTGFTGLFLFLLILAFAFFKTIKTQRLAKNSPSLNWSGDLARATQISLTVYCVTGAALSLVYFELLYIILAVVSLNCRIAEQVVGVSPYRDNRTVTTERRLSHPMPVNFKGFRNLVNNTKSC